MNAKKPWIILAPFCLSLAYVTMARIPMAGCSILYVSWKWGPQTCLAVGIFWMFKTHYGLVTKWALSIRQTGTLCPLFPFYFFRVLCLCFPFFGQGSCWRRRRDRKTAFPKKHGLPITVIFLESLWDIMKPHKWRCYLKLDLQRCFQKGDWMLFFLKPFTLSRNFFSAN